jgi:hypothetical protein
VSILLSASALAAMSQAAVQQAPAFVPGPRITEQIGYFESFCLEGSPTLEESERRGRAARWRPTPYSETGPRSAEPAPPMRIFVRGDFVLVLRQAGPGGRMSVCTVVRNLSNPIDLAALGGYLSGRLNLGAFTSPSRPGGETIAWRVTPGLEVGAYVSPGRPRSLAFTATTGTESDPK